MILICRGELESLGFVPRPGGGAWELLAGRSLHSAEAALRLLLATGELRLPEVQQAAATPVQHREHKRRRLDSGDGAVAAAQETAAAVAAAGASTANPAAAVQFHGGAVTLRQEPSGHVSLEGAALLHIRWGPRVVGSRSGGQRQGWWPQGAGGGQRVALWLQGGYPPLELEPARSPAQPCSLQGAGNCQSC